MDLSIEERSQLSKGLNSDTIENLNPDELMSGDAVSLFFGSLTYETHQKVLSVDSMFAGHQFQNGPKQDTHRAHHLLKGKPFVEDYEYILIPVCYYSQTKVKNAYDKKGHWVLGIYFKATKTLYYLDPYGAKSIPTHVRRIMLNAINSIGPKNTKLKPKVIIFDKHNIQTDSISCGFLICFYGQSFISLGLENLIEENFNLNYYKNYVILRLKELFIAPVINLNSDDDVQAIISSSSDDESIATKKSKTETPSFGIRSLSLKTPNKSNKALFNTNVTPLRNKPQKRLHDGNIKQVATNEELMEIDEVGVTPNYAVNNSLAFDFADIDMQDLQVPLTSGHLKTIKENRWISDIVVAKEIVREIIDKHEEKRLLVFPSVWYIYATFDNWSSDTNMPNRVPTFPKFSSTFEYAIIPINIGSTHWALGILNKARKECIYFCTKKWNLADPYLKKLKTICFLLSGAECRIIIPPKDSFKYQPPHDNYNCGPLICMLIKRYFTNEPMDFDDIEVIAWRTNVYNYHKQFIPIESEDETSTISESGDSLQQISADHKNDINSRNNTNSNISLTSDSMDVDIESYEDFCKNRKKRDTPLERKRYEEYKNSFQINLTKNKGGRPSKKQGKNQYTSNKKVLINKSKDNVKVVISSELTESQKQMPPPQLGTTYDEVTNKRRSSRLAKKLRKLKDITPQCHHTGKIHKEGCAAESVNHKVEYFDVGDFTYRCKFCGRWMSKYEAETPSQANKCCADGKIDLSETHDILQNKIPYVLQHMLDPYKTEYNDELVKKSRAYNSEVAFASISTDGRVPPLPTRGPPVVRLNGNIEHLASDILPPEGKRPAFGQIYVLDLEDAENIRTEAAKEKELDEGILNQLHKMLNDYNSLAKLYKSGSERMNEEIEKARAENKEIPKFRIIIVDAREDKNFTAHDPSIHPHRAEKPQNELVGMIWVNDDGEPPEFKGVWLHGKEGAIHNMPYYSPNIDPLCYPLLFPHGNQMYHNAIPLVNNDTTIQSEKSKKNLMNDDIDIPENERDDYINGGDDDVHEELEESSNELEGFRKGLGRKFVSRKQFYRYFMFPRDKKGFKQSHWLYSKGALAEAYIIDAVCRAEKCELETAKRKIEQSKKRSATKTELRQYIEKKILKGKKLGKLFTIPATFKGGRKHMQKAYSNIMTIIDNTDLPSYFVTFTGNPNWPEIQRNKFHKNEKSRFDLKCRVFLAKAQEFLDDLFKRNVLGKVQGYHVVMEFQKRGMPHLHAILIMQEKVTVEDIDNYISARIPDLPDEKDKSEEAEQQRRYHEIIMRNNIHYCNENSGCQIDGVCSKGYKKPYSNTTIIHQHKPAEYERLPPKSSINKKSDETEKADLPSETGEDQTKNQNENAKNVENNEDEMEELDFQDEPRKDFDEETFVEYRRLPPKPKDVTIDDMNEHLFGNTYMKEIKKNVFVQIDDAHIVPHNKFLSLKYDCHINVECTVGQTGSPKYTCKYTTKGGDVVYIKKQRIKMNENGEEVVDYDEGEVHINARIMTSCEALMRLLCTWIFKQSHIVEALQIHLEGQENVVFEEGAEEQAANKPSKTQLTSFFELCNNDPEACQYTYKDIPYHYRFDKQNKSWIKRKIKPSNFFVRINHVSPREAELYALRILLMNVKGPKSFKDLRTVDGVEYPTFLSIAQALGLWENDDIHFRVIQDAINEMRNQRQKRHFFAMVIAFNQPGNPDKFLDKFLDELFLGYGEDPNKNREQRRRKALNYLEYIFEKIGTSCRRLGFNVLDNFEENCHSKEAEHDYEAPDDLPFVNGKKLTIQEYADVQKAKLNNDQIKAFNEIWNAIENKNGGFYFLQGSGGTGKTFLYNTLITFCQAHGYKVQSCASTGIAATLLKGGMTAHSAFFIPKELGPDSNLNIGAHTKKGEYFKNLNLVIIDEVSMLHKDCMNYIDRILKDLRNNQQLFGNTVVLIGGDWKQLTPVVPRGSEMVIINASIKSWDKFQNSRQLNLEQNMRVNSNELEFIEELKLIGNGDKSLYIKGTDSITVDSAITVKNEADLINFCYEPGWLQNPQKYAKELCGSAILAPLNTVQQRINKVILSKLTGSQQTFSSIDTLLSDKDKYCPLEENDDDYSVEKMHRIETAGMPPHELNLKVGAIVMLIKNLSIFTGLCNGTRMQIVEMNKDFLKCKVLTGPASKSDEVVYIPRVKFEYGNCESEPDIHFIRTQFPIKLAFAMTINKAQGQTLERVGLYFRTSECFSHGQLYTAMSRVRTKDSIRIFTAVPEKPTL